MIKTIALIAVLLALTACTSPQAQGIDPAATGTPQASLSNPASAHCEQQGNRHEIRTAAGGSQTGYCLFPDGSDCEEWAYYRGECGPAASPSATLPVVVETAAPAAHGTPTGTGGTATSEPGSFMPPETEEAFADWWGVIVSTPPGAQFDDYFERHDLGQTLTFGIDSLDPAVHAQIVALRDTGTIVHLYGTLLSNAPDVNGSQVQVDRIEVEE